MAHHYVYGSGMHGCLYDYGPHTAKTLDDAIASLKETFSELSERQLRFMARDLRSQGVHYFSNPEQAGAQYCEAKQEESDPKIAALAEHLDVSYGSIDEEGGGDWYTCEEQRGEWYVLTDEEADARADARLNDYIEECVLDEIPERYRPYFDRAAWKKDVLDEGGRGQRLAGYDGEENDETIDGVTYYIYRQG